MKFISLILLISSILVANNLPIKNQDVSPEQLRKQNKEIVQLVAKELSKDLPKTIDKYTKFVKIVGKGSDLIYTFTINTGSKNDETVKKEDKTRMKEAITNGVCKSSKRFMDAKITIIYNYISAVSKVDLFSFKINQDICFKLSRR